MLITSLDVVRYLIMSAVPHGEVPDLLDRCSLLKSMISEIYSNGSIHALGYHFLHHQNICTLRWWCRPFVVGVKK